MPHLSQDFYVCSLSSNKVVYKGQLTPEQLPEYYSDLQDKDLHSHFALVHSRFSTNTFPSWDRAQPSRMMCHNGEINTLRGNVNWMLAREATAVSPSLGPHQTAALFPTCSDEYSDSGNLDAVLELLTQTSSMSMPEAILMLVRPVLFFLICISSQEHNNAQTHTLEYRYPRRIKASKDFILI